MADNAECFAWSNVIEDSIDNLRVWLHWGSAGLFAGAGIGLFKFLNDLEHFITPDDRIIHDELKGRSVLEDDCAAHEALDAFAMAGQQVQASLLLVGITENADKHDGGVKVARHVDIVNGDQSGFADWEFAPDHFTDLALQQFANPLESKRRHKCQVLQCARVIARAGD